MCTNILVHTGSQGGRIYLAPRMLELCIWRHWEITFAAEDNRTAIHNLGGGGGHLIRKINKTGILNVLLKMLKWYVWIGKNGSACGILELRIVWWCEAKLVSLIPNMTANQRKKCFGIIILRNQNMLTSIQKNIPLSRNDIFSQLMAL